MFLVLVRKAMEEEFWYLAKDGRSITKHRSQAAEFHTHGEAVAVGEQVVKLDSLLEVKVVMQ